MSYVTSCDTLGVMLPMNLSNGHSSSMSDRLLLFLVDWKSDSASFLIEGESLSETERWRARLLCLAPNVEISIRNDYLHKLNGHENNATALPPELP